MSRVAREMQAQRERWGITMTNDEILERIIVIRDDVLEIARASLTTGDVVKFSKLNEVAVTLTELAPVDISVGVPRSPSAVGRDYTAPTGLDAGPGQRNSMLQVVPVFARYHGTRYDAELDTSRIGSNGRGECINFRGKWMTPGRATALITTTRPGAWRFWRFARPDGTEGRIQEIRDSSAGNVMQFRPAKARTRHSSSGIRSTVHTILSAESPLHRKIILERLFDRGVHIGGKTPLRTLAAHLSGDDRFQAVGDGNWAISDGAPDIVRDPSSGIGSNSMQSSLGASELRNTVFEILNFERPLHRREIYQRALELGIHVGGKSPINNLGAHMSGDPRFKSDGNGYWTLSTVTVGQGRRSNLKATTKMMRTCHGDGRQFQE